MADLSVLLPLLLGKLPPGTQKTVSDILADVPEVLALYADIKAGIDALHAIPPASRKATDYALAFGAAKDGALWHVAVLIDQIEAQTAKPAAGG